MLYSLAHTAVVLFTIDVGSTLVSEVSCMNCSGHSRGRHCDECEQGYFLGPNETCTACLCNGHGMNNTCSYSEWLDLCTVPRTFS